MENEKEIRKTENGPVLRWLGRGIGRTKWYLLLLVLIQGILGAAGVYYAVLLRNAVDQAVEKKVSGFWFWTGMAAALLLGQILLRAVYRFLEEYSRAGLENLLKKRLVDSVFRGDYSRISATHSGEWMNRITSDTVVVADGFVQILPGIAGMVVKLCGALLLILFYLPGFGGCLLVGGVALLLFTYGFRRVLKKLHKNIQEADGAFRSFTQENITSLILVKAFVKEEEISGLVSEKMEQHKKARMKKNHFSNFCNIGFSVAMNGVYLLGLVVSGYGIVKGTLSYGTLMAVLQLVGQVQSPFANITGYLPKYYSMLASAERIMEVEKHRESGTEHIIPPEQVLDLYKSRLSGIAVERLTFSYHGDAEKILNQYSLYIKKGEYIAFTGESGCGKSTLLKLFMGMYAPEEGHIYLDMGAVEGGQGTQCMLDKSYRRLFAYVPQGNFLMSGTIRDIVTFYEKESGKKDEEIYAALRIACAEEFVRELPEGLDTILGERGVGLSEGQMQRIAVARAVYSGNPVLLLDEATSALDEGTEAQLLKNLRQLTDRTVLIVTHRPAALEICDRAVQME